MRIQPELVAEVVEVGDRVDIGGARRGVENETIDAGAAGERVVVGAAHERVIAEPAIERVRRSVAGDRIAQEIAGAVDRCHTGENQLVDIVGQFGDGDRRPDRVDTATDGFGHHIAHSVAPGARLACRSSVSGDGARNAGR